MRILPRIPRMDGHIESGRFAERAALTVVQEIYSEVLCLKKALALAAP